MTPHDLARKALASLELSTLGPATTAADVERACARARTPHNDVAAVCVPPNHVSLARALLGSSRIAVATVANYPSGLDAHEPVRAEMARAADNGADEFALVAPYRAFAEGRVDVAARILDAARREAGSRRLKVIVETGMLREPGVVRRLCDLAIDEGADMIQTSTGAVEENATPDAVDWVLSSIASSWRPTGLAIAGAISRLEEARLYFDAAAAMMGRDWITPRTTRLVSADLLGAILSALDATDSESAA